MIVELSEPDMNPEITDQTLVLQRLKEGDEKTFELLFSRYYAALCFFANKILKDEEAARDVVQEVFIRFYEKSYDFPNLIALKSFLYSCVQSKALNALEKQNTRTFLKQRLDTPKYEEATYFRHQIEAEIFEEIFAAIEELPSECRADFQNELPGAHGHPGNIQKNYKLPESTVKTQRQRAKQYLPQTLKKLVHFSYFPIFRIKDQPTERKISITIGFSPLKKNSTAITITISPINRIITLLPVSPSILIIREESSQNEIIPK